MAHSPKGQSHTSMMKIAEHQALMLGVDDHFGLWELLWALRAQLPNDDDAVLIKAASKALKHLTDKGFVRIVRSDPRSQREEDLSRWETQEAMTNQAHWEAPQTEVAPQIRFVATEAGERDYYEPQRSISA